ncbi:hypothetical protein GW931_01960 [archaeon]|nr:hypothetical protein [archaeon]
MNQEEIQKVCLEKNVLLEKPLFDFFSSFENSLVLGLLLEKIKTLSGKRFITNSLFEKNKKEMSEFIEKSNLSKEINQKEFYDLLKISSKQKEEEISKGGGEVKVVSSIGSLGKKLEVKDFVAHFRNRYEEVKEILQERKGLDNLFSIDKISNEKQKFSVIGMVYSKKVTKNNNLLLEVEDLTGKMKVLISASKEELIKEAEEISLDTIIGFKGVGNSDILFVNELFFPESSLPERKKSKIEEVALFIGDVHYGSKNFLEKDFLNFIDFLNGNSLKSKKVKYLFIVGDLITGIGNYPGQEGDLKIKDLEEQFKNISSILNKIRKDIKIIISPGNHDCVRLMEPQPLLDEKYAWPLYELENVIIVGNPSTVNLGQTKNFEGHDVLIYHGFSFPFYANNIPHLIEGKTMNQPEKIMKYLLKHRHLAPTYTSNQFFPLEKDGLLIRKTPDIFVSGHTHKSGVTYFNNVLIISVSSWEGLTSYQEKFGNKPDHCKVPMLNLKTRQIKILDFETGEDGIKLYQEDQ